MWNRGELAGGHIWIVSLGCAIAAVAGDQVGYFIGRQAGPRLFTFLRYPPEQWKSIRTTNAIERLHVAIEDVELFDMIDAERASNRWSPGRDGDTTYLCAIDAHGMGVSLIQSNAAGFGSGLIEPNTGINLHNRGLGFNLREGHPAEFRAGHRPPHTLCPAMATACRTRTCC